MWWLFKNSLYVLEIHSEILVDIYRFNNMPEIDFKITLWRGMGFCKLWGFCPSDRWEIVSQYSFHLHLSCSGQYNCYFCYLVCQRMRNLSWFMFPLMPLTQFPPTAFELTYSIIHYFSNIFNIPLMVSFLFKFKYLSFLYFLARYYI